MFKAGKHLSTSVLVMALLTLILAACSETGGAPREEAQGSEGAAGRANTPAATVAMVTHGPQGDTFWDIIRTGAQAAADKDNITLEYSSDADPSQQANLIQNAVDRGVAGIAVTMPNSEALSGPIQQAVEAGIPVTMLNAGFQDWQDTGALMYFGQDESVAGQAAGEKLNEEGAAKVLCVPQEQGQSQLEARCDGVEQTFQGEYEKLYVEGTNMPSVQSTISSKLRQDPNISHVLTLGAPFALAAVQAAEEAGSEAQVATFDTNAELVAAIQAGDVQWAIDQQPYLQGYGAIDALWLYINNRNVLGGGDAVLTGPSFIDESNIEEIAELARRGTR
jgi:simple sugar transport system substrate-binding protein